MADPAIIVKNLGKRYTLGQRSSGSYRTLRDTLAGLLNQESGIKNLESKEFWALRDVSFEIQRGEVVGIIGRNGAGKSTLLKVLSRITEPTTGRVTLNGRVASLLEVGTGFHPELTGRENIFLNGAIMGMKKTEIRARFDEIVAFAEVEQFLDTPVKRYSSGMYVRLAFAVAAHLEPEILIVDEVLAVGDAAFQSKCLGKMHDMAQCSGRTVLFVSHNLSAVRQLTAHCLVLKKGQVSHLGNAESAIEHYLQSNEVVSNDVAQQPRVHECSGGARFVELRFKTSPAVFTSGDRMEFITVIVWDKAVSEARISLTIFTQESNAVGSGFSATCIRAESAGHSSLAVCIPAVTLAPGRYHCTIALGMKTGGTAVNMDAVSNVLHFEILAAESDGHTPLQWSPNWGSLRLSGLEVSPLT